MKCRKGERRVKSGGTEGWRRTMERKREGEKLGEIDRHERTT